jgi:hypothetical protein
VFLVAVGKFWRARIFDRGKKENSGGGGALSFLRHCAHSVLFDCIVARAGRGVCSTLYLTARYCVGSCIALTQTKFFATMRAKHCRDVFRNDTDSLLINRLEKN